MDKSIILLIISLVICSCSSTPGDNDQSDPYIWLEDVEGGKALEWVEARNASTIETFQQHHDFQEVNKKILDILNSDERIAYPSMVGEYVYNFWQDDRNQRGLWRRTTLEEYFANSPDWEAVLDVDALCQQEGEKWAFHGASFLYPEFDLALVHLSRGGGDAAVIREFDLKRMTFAEDGFQVPQAKSRIDWIDRDHVMIATDFGEGTMTTSGYPRIVKIWNRGTPLSKAETIFEANTDDMGCYVVVINTPERQYSGITRAITFYTYAFYMMEDGELIKLDIPEDASLHGFFKNHMLIELKSNWNIKGKTYKQGALIGIDYQKFLSGNRDFKVIYEPDERSSLVSSSTTRNFLLVNTLNNVRSELYKYSLLNDRWIAEKVDAPDYGTLSVIDTEILSNRYFFQYQNFLQPTSLYFVSADGQKMKKVKSLPAFYHSENFKVQQWEAVSRDGTRIPYFIVTAKNVQFDGTNPTLLYGYGGFEVSERPYYLATTGAAWLEKGGIYAVANIRGGGEFGPRWHQAALKENRQLAFDDFIAVSEDLISRKITSPEHLGIMGGSNGGLLVGVAFTQRPDLYSAVVCQVPLLDMQRYNKLLAGASWMAEYGNPDIPEEWEYIKKYSPYHDLQSSACYPQVFFTTTTRDDRVHPGHARKMAARMQAQNHDFFYFENTEGGHGSGVTNEQRAFMKTLEFIYLLKMLK